MSKVSNMSIDAGGNIRWICNRKLHRIDGPAVIDPMGRCFWYINGRHLTRTIFAWARENNIDLNNLTDNDKMIIKLTWL
jgi:hypothetical protein